MSGTNVNGLAEQFAFFDNLPQAAREELGVELAIIGREGLAAQKAIVAARAHDTGRLEAGLSVQLLVDQLKVRMGLIGVAATSKSATRHAAKKGGGDPRNYGDLFYGRIVYFGRRAQTVMVERRRRVNGALRQQKGRRKRASDIVSRYAMRIEARAAIPFIDAPGPLFERDALGQLGEYWSRVLNRAGAA